MFARHCFFKNVNEQIRLIGFTHLFVTITTAINYIVYCKKFFQIQQFEIPVFFHLSECQANQFMIMFLMTIKNALTLLVIMINRFGLLNLGAIVDHKLV